jgi:hypothetical protein
VTADSEEWDSAEAPLHANGHSPDWRVSLIKDVGDTAAVPISFRAVLSDIASHKWAQRIADCRAAYSRGWSGATPEFSPKLKRMETIEEARIRCAKDAADPHKKALPGVLFSGLFSHRAKSALIQHSGLICADLDHLGDRIEQIFEHITSDPYTLACFRSPTGTGLKVVFRCDPEIPHEISFAACRTHVLSAFGLHIDEACKDVSRICFVSADPEAFVAEDASVLPYPAEAFGEVREFKPLHDSTDGNKPGDDFDRRGNVPELLIKNGWKKAHGPYWTRPGKASGVSASWGVVPNRFWVFSSSVAGLETKHVYKPWHLYAILEHEGDFQSAVRQLGKDGYGAPPKKSRQQQNLERFAGPEPEKPVPEDELEKRRVTLASRPQEPVTRLFLAGKPIATPGNLTTLISRAKTGKTATIGGVVAAIIASHYDRTGLDTLGFTAPHTKEAVVLIDTEQSPYDAYTCHQRAFARAAQEADIDWMMHYALVGMSAKQLAESLPNILARAKEKHGAVFTVILDGVADFVASVNDEAESNEFITWLRKLAVDYDCPIICVIHSNEAKMSGDDGRGHLGKQLTRKAESNLLLKKTGEITTITSEKQRKAPITEADGVAFVWSDEHGRHITCDPADLPQRAKGGRPKDTTFESLAAIWPKKAEKALTMGQLLLYAKDEDGTSESTLRRIVKAAVQVGQLVKLPGPIGPRYHLPD